MSWQLQLEGNPEIIQSNLFIYKIPFLIKNMDKLPVFFLRLCVRKKYAQKIESWFLISDISVWYDSEDMYK